MSRKLLNKLTSIILVLAICSATVFGCVLNTSAFYSGTYTFSGGIAAYGAKQASVDLTFNLDAGFVAGDFAVTNANSYFTDVSVKVKSGTLKDGSAFDASNIVAEFVADETGKYLGYVTFWTNTLKYYTSLTFELTYTMTDWVKAGGAKYATDIAEVVLAAESDVDVTVTGSAGNIHNHHAWLNNEDLDATTAGDGYHLVYDTNCHICSSQHAIKQVMPNYTQIDGATGFDKYPNGNLGISAVNVVYNDDGTVNLKIHGYSPHYRGGNYIVVTDTEGKIYDKYELKTNTTSQYAGNVLVDNAQVWTLENMSARDIDTELLFTMMYNDNGTVRTSTSVPFSLADYCTSVVEGNAVWAEDATNEQIEADKDLAAALYLYGAKTNDYYNNPVIDNGGEDEGEGETQYPVNVQVTSVNKVTKTWKVTQIENEDAFLAAVTGSGTDKDPYIIDTPEELCYLANYAGANSAGKYYKVDDSVGAFNMTSYGINETAANIQSTLEDKISTWNKWWYNGSDNPFQGNFDGNGIVIYGLHGEAWQSGLFPKVSGTVTIKNLTVKASGFKSSGNSGAGAIIGSVGASSVTIENCAVENCYLKSAGSGPIGIMVGNLNNNSPLIITNCFVKDNICEASTNYPYGGITSGANYSNATSYQYSNIIAIGNTPFATVPDSSAYYSANVNNATNYTNVYTDQTVDTSVYSATQIKQLTTANMQGENALTNMQLSDSIWLATSGYPEFSCNHQFAITQYDETGHTYSCIVTLDGAACDIDSYKEDHKLVVNKETWIATCECGYSTAVEPSVTPVEKTIATWNGSDKPTTLAASGMTGSGSVGDPYIIKTAAQLWYVAQLAGAESAGNYYKVDDTIGAFDMQNNTWGLQDNSIYFQGTFDGNGVQIVNFKANGWNIGLFPRIAGDVTIKNVKVSGATVTSSGADAGAIVGNIATTANATISGCVVINSTVSGKCGAGAIIGSAGAQTLVVENCFVANNTVDANTAEEATTEYEDNAVIGYGHTKTRTLNNTIAIGNDPNVRVSSASKVYTDQASSVSGITQKTVEELKGAGVVAELEFDDAIWFDTNSYPELYVMHEMQIIPVNDSTHKHACGVVLGGVACGLEVSSEHNVTMNGTTATCNDCGHSYEVKGIVVPVEKKTVPWTISFAMDTEDEFQASLGENDGSGTANEPYIIRTAEQFAYISNFAGANSAGVYYKVADDIGAFDFTSYSKDLTATEVEAAFQALVRQGKWYNKANNYPFQGTFDGNGAVFFGVDGKSYQTGLFPLVQGATIKNLTVQASRFYTTGPNGAGAIAGRAATGGVTIENCAVKNCYITSDGAGPLGIMVGNVGNNNNIIINNCLVENNIVTASTTYPYGGLSSAGYTQAQYYQYSNIIAIGNNPVPVTSHISDAGLTHVATASCYTNVYTDQTVDSATYGTNVKQLLTANMQGANAQANMSLNFDDIWLATSGYPVLRAMHELAVKSNGASGHTEVCAVVLDDVECEIEGITKSHKLVLNSAGTLYECDCGYSEEFISGIITEIPAIITNQLNKNALYTSDFTSASAFKDAYAADNNPTSNTSDCYMYASSLNLKTNPHIAFTFALMNDYKTNKANVTFTFKVGGETIATATGDQLINNTGAGRYHLYRFKSLPVTKLCEQVSITATYSGNTTNMGTYSAAGYAINAMNAGSAYVHHANVAMSLVFYSEMLAARYGA